MWILWWFFSSLVFLLLLLIQSSLLVLTKKGDVKGTKEKKKVNKNKDMLGITIYYFLNAALFFRNMYIGTSWSKTKNIF